MDLLKIFNYNENHITVIGDIENPYFKAADVATILDVGCMKSILRDYDEDEKTVIVHKTTGGPQKTLFLSEIGLYRFINHSRKPLAKPFQKWCATVIKELRHRGTYELQTTLRKLQDKIDSGDYLHKSFKALEKHNYIRETQKCKKVVYIIKLHEEANGDTIIKIGASNNIISREDDLYTDYNNVTFTDVFPCEENFAFESFLHHHQDIKPHRHAWVTKRNSQAREVYKLSKALTYEQIMSIIKSNIKDFSGGNHQMLLDQKYLQVRMAEIEVEKQKASNPAFSIDDALKPLKDDLCAMSETMNSMMALFSDCVQKMGQDSATNKKNVTYKTASTQTDEPSCTQIKYTKEIKPTRGDQVQVYYAQNVNILVGHYPSYIEAVRAMTDLKVTRSGIKFAAENKTIYKNHRWHLVPQDQDASIPQILEQHNETIITQRKGLIAMLNLQRNKIDEVFPDQKSAAQSRKHSGLAAINKALHNGSISSGHYFSYWDDCSAALQNEYLSREELPKPPCPKGAINVYQLDPASGLVIKTYNSVQQAQNTMQFSRLSLKKAIENDIILKGFKWRLSVPK
jgi:prophage antirepressor-like protein